jgi:sarcosine oxidase subunit gamma
VADGVRDPVSALEGRVAPGRYGRRAGSPGVIAREVRGFGLALVTARLGRRAAVVEAARLAFGVEPPQGPRWVAGGGIMLIGCGPDQWLAYRAAAPAEGMERLLAPLTAHAAVVDQSHGRTILRVTGEKVREALAKGVTVDLHPRVFKPGDAAATLVSHLPVQLWQLDEAPTYEFAVARSLVLAFWHWLEAAAAEFGLELTPPVDPSDRAG